MALIPPFFLDTVVAIGTANTKGEKSWIGTGFLYGQLIADKKYKVYLVTNKHVLEGKDFILVRFNPKTNDPSTDFPISLRQKNEQFTWTSHPDPKIDIAVININANLLKEKGMKFRFFESDTHISTISDMKNSETAEGDFIYVLGFPMGIVAHDRQNVICRNGTIARIRDLYEGRSNDYLIDSFIFPGNSGGPVISKPEFISIEGTKANTNASLIGIVKQYVPYHDVAYSHQTNRPRVIFEENSGLSLVVPADFIIGTIEFDQKRQLNQ